MGTIQATEEARPTVSAGGVTDDKWWYVAIVKRNSEKDCRDRLQKEGFEAFVATQTMMRRYSKRRPKPVEYVRIAAKVFLHMDTMPKGQALTRFFASHPYISSFMPDHARGQTGRPAYAQIRDSEMHAMRMILGDPDHEVTFGYPDSSFEVGDIVQAIRGPLQGKRGVLSKKEGKSFFCLLIENLDWAKVQIAPEDVVPVTAATPF